MKLTPEELDLFPLQEGFTPGPGYEVNLTMDGRRLDIAISAIDADPNGLLTYNGVAYRFYRMWETTTPEGIDVIQIRYVA